MTTTIQVDFEALADIGLRFQQQADNTQGILQNLKQAFDPLQQGGWMGLGAAAYIDEMGTTVLPAVERLIEALALTAQTTNALTELIRTAEQEATADIQTATDERSEGSSTDKTPVASEAGSGTSVGNPIPTQPDLKDNASFTPNEPLTNSAPGNSTDSAVSPNLGQFKDQPTGASGSANNEPSTKPWGRPDGDTATTSPTEIEENGLGLAFGLAAASPFAALLGKAIKDRSTEDNS